MPQIFTTSFRRYRPEMGTAVVTSLGLPKWLPEAQSWPRCWVITPTPTLFHLADDDEFARLYVERLDRFGAQKISRALQRIAVEHQAGKLVLLCHESDWDSCHRKLFAAWLMEATGELCREM